MVYISISDDLPEKEVIDPRIQVLFKRYRHNNLSIFIISQNYYELSKRTIGAHCSTYLIFKPNNYKKVQNLYRNKASMYMTLSEIKIYSPLVGIKNINFSQLI